MAKATEDIIKWTANMNATTIELSDAARTLANQLFRSDGIECSRLREPTAISGSDSCLRDEEARPLTPEEKIRGWAQRPFWAYESNRLCSGCRAYWYAEMAAQTLEQHIAFKTKYGT